MHGEEEDEIVAVFDEVFLDPECNGVFHVFGQHVDYETNKKV